MDDGWRAPRGVDADSTAVRWMGNIKAVPALTAADVAAIAPLWEDLHPWLRRRFLGEEGLEALQHAVEHPDELAGERPAAERLLGSTTSHLSREARLLAVVPTRPAEVIVQRDDLADRLDRLFHPDIWIWVESIAPVVRLTVLELGARHPERRMPVLVGEGAERAHIVATPSMFFPLATPGTGGGPSGDASGDRAPLVPAPTWPGGRVAQDEPTDA